MNGLAALLGHSPELFPYVLDVPTDTVSFIRLSEAEYERASFLDARLRTAQMHHKAVPWVQVAPAIAEARLTERCDFIFHIGHVGSTLLSRLMGAHAGAFALREPQILRTFAQIRAAPALPHGWTDTDFAARLDGCLKLLSRTFHARQRAVIKATSFVSDLAAQLLARAASPKAVMLFVSPETYLATIFAGPNSRKEAQIMTPSRWQRLNRRAGTTICDLAKLSEGEAIALGWACETAALAQAAHGRAEQILRLDFDGFLEDPARLCLAALLHMGISATADEAAAIVGGLHMERYSKAPEFAYDADLRLSLLTEARAAHGAQIRRGLQWLEISASAHACVRDALVFAKTHDRRSARI